MQDYFDYRFSSEVFDTESRLSYYNYRYYSPELGRWIKRDPIGEIGGYNLYEMVINNAVN
jgi:RHS repeat-associated protein